MGRKSFQLSPLPFAHITMVLDILNQAGFQRNPKKGHLTSSQRFDYLVILRDLKELRIFLPQKKDFRFQLARVKLAEEPYLEFGAEFFREENYCQESCGSRTSTPKSFAWMGNRSPSVALTTDTPISGRGSKSASGRWSTNESKLLINHLELPAALWYTAVYVI